MYRAQLVSQAIGNALASGHNEALPIFLAEFQEDHLEAAIVTFDFATLLSNAQQKGAALGFTDTTTPCYTGAIAGFASALPNPRAVCANPEQHLFWDGVHPTGHAHQVWGEALAAQIRPLVSSASSSTSSRKLLGKTAAAVVTENVVHGRPL